MRRIMKLGISILYMVIIELSKSQELDCTGLPFTCDDTDVITEPNDDKSSGEVQLSKPMEFFGQHSSFYQNTNGLVTLSKPYSKYNLVDEQFPSKEVPSGVAVYWTDIDTRLGGNDTNKLYARGVTKAADLQKAKEIIQRVNNGFEPKWTAVATYYRVNPYDRNETAENSFQMAFAYNENETWVILAYEKLQFFDPLSSSNNTLIGMNGGSATDGILEFNINSTSEMEELANGTNCEQPGVYAFIVTNKTNDKGSESEDGPFQQLLERLGELLERIGNLFTMASNTIKELVDSVIDFFRTFLGQFQVSSLTQEVDKKHKS